MTISFEKTFQGAWRLSAMIDGRHFTRQYFGYTKKEARAEFMTELREGDL